VRFLVPIVVMAGCSFVAEPTGDPQPQPQPSPGGNPDASNPIARTCHVADPALRLCLDFEDASLVPITHDGSEEPMPNDAVTIAVVPMLRGLEQAAQVGASSSIIVAPSPELEVSPNLTIEMWVDPSALPHGTLVYPLASTGAYALSIDDKGAVGCSIGAFQIAGGTVATNAWTHVACTFDGAQLSVYTNGDAAQCQQHAGAIPLAMAIGLGSNGYLGGLDNAHLYARALSAAEICSRAGRTNCAPCGGQD
jgi:hypothetical protein